MSDSEHDPVETKVPEEVPQETPKKSKKKKKDKKDKKNKKDKSSSKSSSSDKSSKKKKKKSKSKSNDEVKEEDTDVETKVVNATDAEDNTEDGTDTGSTSGSSEKKSTRVKPSVLQAELYARFEEWDAKNSELPKEDQEKASDHFTAYDLEFCHAQRLVNTLEASLRDAKEGRRRAGTRWNAARRKQVKKDERGNTGKRRRNGFDKSYPVSPELFAVLTSDEFMPFVESATPKSVDVVSFDPEAGDNARITGSQLADACLHYGASLNEEGKKLVSIVDEDTPPGMIFRDFLRNLELPEFPAKFKPSDNSIKADRTSLTRSQMISYASKYLARAEDMATA